jgi:hypothetical protein
VPSPFSRSLKESDDRTDDEINAGGADGEPSEKQQMIDGIVSGRLHGAPAEGSGQGGSRYVTARVKAVAGDGDTLIVNVIAFVDAVRQALLDLEDGESVALSGSLTPKVWTDRHGDARPALDMVAHALLTAHRARD